MSENFLFSNAGSLETLDVQPKACGKNTRDELIKFYTAHYSANLMRLVVYGKGRSTTVHFSIRKHKEKARVNINCLRFLKYKSNSFLA